LTAAYYTKVLKAKELNGKPNQEEIEASNNAMQDFHKLALELGFLEGCQVPENKLARWDRWLLFNPF